MKVVNDLPDNCEGKTLDVTSAKRRARRNRKLVERAQQPIPLITPDDIRLYHCPFQELEVGAGIAPGSVSLILTDIPYDGAFLPQVSELADLASRLLAEGGLFVTYCGQFYLPEIFRRLDEHLTYAWTRASVWDGDGNLIHPRDVTSQWKPIVVYSKGNWVKRGHWPDVSRVNSKEKDWHPWQQPLGEVEQMVRYFSEAGDLVVDPCGGGFTTAVACHRTNRRFIGCDSDESCVVRGRQRLAEVVRVEPFDTEEAPAEQAHSPARSPEKLLEDLRIWIEDAADGQFNQSAVLDTWDRFSGLSRSQFPNYLALLPESYHAMWLSLAV